MQRLLVYLLTAIIVLISFQSPLSAQYDWTFDPGNPLLGDGSGRLLEPSILYDADRNQFDLWYSDGQSVRRAVSSDGRTWNLSGSYQSLTSLFSIPFCYGVEIVKIGSTYYMYSSCQSADYNSYYIGLATSADGNSWTKHSSSPALTPRGSGSWENTYIMYPKIVQLNGVYYMYYQGDASQAEIGLATSADGVHWEEYEGNPVIRVQDVGGNAAGLAPSGLENVNGMFYMLMNTADNALHANTNLMTSSDGISWSYYQGNPVLTTGAPGTWNGGWIGEWDPPTTSQGKYLVLVLRDRYEALSGFPDVSNGSGNQRRRWSRWFLASHEWPRCRSRCAQPCVKLKRGPICGHLDRRRGLQNHEQRRHLDGLWCHPKHKPRAGASRRSP